MRKVTLSLIALTLLVAGFLLAQVTTAKAVSEAPRTFSVVTPVGESPAQMRLPQHVQLTESDLRLRIEGEHDGRVIGTLMANVNGQWVEVILASKNMRAAAAPAINR